MLDNLALISVKNNGWHIRNYWIVTKGLNRKILFKFFSSQSFPERLMLMFLKALKNYLYLSLLEYTEKDILSKARWFLYPQNQTYASGPEIMPIASFASQYSIIVKCVLVIKPESRRPQLAYS